MRRSSSTLLALLLLAFIVVRGLMLGLSTNHVLTSGLVVFFGFHLTVLCIGWLMPSTTWESEENCFECK